jgi:RNase P/RNase MRP subunit POP5
MKKTKLKLKPSQRDKRRYFLILKPKKEIEKIILDYLGIFGSAKADYIEVKTSDFYGKIIGSVLRESLEDVRAALALEGISVEKVSGTIKGLGK